MIGMESKVSGAIGMDDGWVSDTTKGFREIRTFGIVWGWGGLALAEGVIGIG